MGAWMRRRSDAEVERLVSEFEQSGLGRKEFSAAHGLSVHTLDAWRRRVVKSGADEKIVPVEIVEDCGAGWGSARAASAVQNRQFRVVLADGLRIEVEPGFDAVELPRLLAALNHTRLSNGLLQPV